MSIFQSQLVNSMNPFILPVMGYVVPLLLFYTDGFGIYKLLKADMLLNKETKFSYINQRHETNKNKTPLSLCLLYYNLHLRMLIHRCNVIC